MSSQPSWPVPRRLVGRNANELLALGGGVGEAIEGTTSVESILLK
ncbi:hypothetical protein WME91_19070 [Sorangium sp. So ce269]